MELLRWFFEGVVALLRLYLGFWMELGGLAREAMGLNMPAAVMDFISILIGIGVLVGPLYRVLHWNRHGNHPQAIVLHTALTPDQVVRNDRADLLRVILTAVVIGIALAFFISSISPPP